jgi:hypothetical protein
MKRDGPKAPTAVHGRLVITYHPNEKANTLADCLENEFTSDELCDENMSDGWGLDSASVNIQLGKVRPVTYMK